MLNYVESLDVTDILSKKSINLIKTYSNFKIVFIDEKEGGFFHSDLFFKKLYELYTNIGLSNSEQIIYITNSASITEEYNNFLQINGISNFMKVDTLDFYILSDAGYNIENYINLTSSKYTTILDRNVSYSIPNVDELDKKRTKYFLSLNRNSGRLHRPKLVLELIKNNLFDKGLISLLKSEEFERFANENGNELYKEFIADRYPFVVDYDDAELVSDMHNFFTKKDMWMDTYFSVVSETSASDDWCFITEKTVRPMIYYHPFIVWGNPGTLNRLRKLGYLVKPRDVLLKGTIDVLPSLLTKSEDGRELYTYILQNADKIKTESDIYNRSITTLSNEVKSQLKVTLRRSSVTNSLPHNMKHQEPDRNGLSMSKMRDDLVNQNIKTTFDAILAKLRTQTTRKFKDKSALKVGEIVRVTTYGRAPIYVKITNISDTSVGENLAKDYAKLGIKYDPNNIKAEDLERSEYAKEWSKKQGWDISYMMFNMDSLKDKYDIDFEYIPDIEEYAKETNQVIVINKFGWSIDDSLKYDKYKALNANGFIGYTDVNSINSRVNGYIRNTSNQGIPMNNDLVPNSSSVVFVAVPDSDTMSKTVKDKILKKAIEVLEAGGTLLMSNLTRANNEFNKDGEGVILKELYDRFNNLTNSNMLNYTKYSLPNFERDLETDGQVDQDCK
jgi:hypothetical protein